MAQDRAERADSLEHRSGRRPLYHVGKREDQPRLRQGHTDQLRRLCGGRLDGGTVAEGRPWLAPAGLQCRWEELTAAGAACLAAPVTGQLRLAEGLVRPHVAGHVPAEQRQPDRPIGGIGVHGQDDEAGHLRPGVAGHQWRPEGRHTALRGGLLQVAGRRGGVPRGCLALYGGHMEQAGGAGTRTRLRRGAAGAEDHRQHHGDGGLYVEQVASHVRPRGHGAQRRA